MEIVTNLQLMPDTKEFDKQIPDVIVKANSFKILNQEDYATAVDFGKSIKRLIEQVDETFKKPIDLAHQAHKSMCAARNKHLNPLTEAIEIMRRVTGSWVQEQRKIADAAAAKAREEANAEAERIMRTDLEKKTKERLAQAVELEALGFTQEADSVINTPIAAAPVVAQVAYTAPAVAKVEGVSARKKFEFEITDKAILPEEYKLADEVKIRKMVNALGADCKIAGVRIFEKIQMNFSGK